MSRATVLRAFAFGAAAIPFAFGLIRAVTAGGDVRYVLTAAAALAGALLPLRPRKGSGALQSLAVIVAKQAALAILFGFVAAWISGARNVASMTVVTVSMGACFALAGWLWVHAEIEAMRMRISATVTK